MMFVQFTIWKQLITEQAPLSSRHVSKAMSLLPSLAIYEKPNPKFPTFCTETTAPCTIPPDRGVVTEFLLNKCSLTEEDITRVFKIRSQLLRVKSTANCQKILDFLNGCGLTTPAQIRKAILCYPGLLVDLSERNMKSKVNFLRTFMREEDIAKLIYRNSRFISYSEDRLKSAVLLLQKMGLDDKAISHLLVMDPRFLMASEKDVMESLKNAEDLGFKKGSKMFALALQRILRVGKEEIDRRRLYLSSSGFSEKQILDIFRRYPVVLSLSEEKVKRNMDFLVSSVGLPLDDLVKYPLLFGYSLEKRMIPRYRVMESMQVPKTKRSFPAFCALSERQFLERHIHINAESSSVLLDIYNGGKLIVKTDSGKV